jgi:uncharacterized protein (UPF0332 family)
MKGHDFLIVAQNLARDSTEAAWRSAISRAYYAAFHVARELMTDLGFTVPQGDSTHGYAWIRLQNCGDAQAKKAGSNLNVLRGLRNKADYDLRPPLRQSSAAAQVNIAEQVIQALVGAALEPTRTQITDAMMLFERTVLKVTTWHP